MSGEPVASLEVLVSARIDRAERNLQAFEQQLDRTAGRARQTSEEIRQQAQQVGNSAASTGKLTTALKDADRAMSGYERALSTATKNATQAERADQRLADAKIRAAASAKNYGEALRLIEAEMNRAGAGSLRFIQLQSTQQRVFDQSARAADQNRNALKALGGGALQVAAAFGLATSVGAAFQQVLDRTVQGFMLSAELDRSERSLGVLLGSQQKANAVFDEANAFGQKYKFTQKEISDAVQGASRIIKESNQPVEMVIGTLSRLQTLNPEETIAGAARALSELKAGQIESIVERFNLSRTAANAMKKEIESGKDPVLVLDAALNKMGVTNDALKVRTEGTTGALNDAKIASENLNLALGRVAESKGAVEIVNWLAEGANGLATWLNYGSELEQFNARIASGAGNYEQYVAGINKANAAIPSYLAKIQALTAEQYAYARSLIATGTPADQAIIKARAVASTAQLIASAVGPARLQLQQMAPTLLHVANMSDVHRASVDALIAALNAGHITTEQFTAQIQFMANREVEATREAGRLASVQAQLTTSTKDTSTALAEHTAALQKDATEQLLNAAKSQELGLAKEQLEARARSAAAGLLASGDAGAATAARLAASSSQVDQLTAAFYRLQAAQASAKAYQQANADYRAGERDSSTLKSPLGAAAQERQNSAARAAQAEIAKEQQAAAARANKQAQQAAKAAARANAAAAKKSATAAKRAQNEAKKAANVAAREQAELEKAKLDLMDDQGKLQEYQKRLSRTTDEADRLELLKKIQDTEQRIAEQKERQVKAALEARLAAIDDRKKRREEQKELEKARRVLGSAGASEEMKQAARDVLERIPLEQQKRQQEIAEKTRDAAGQVAPGAVAPGMSSAPPTGAPTALPISTMPVGTPALMAPPSPQVGAPQPITTIDVSVYLDSEQIAAAFDARVSTGLAGAKARGKGAN